jgi:hypothetical protein
MTAALAGWQASAGRRSATFPVSVTLPANGYLWCTRKAVSFTLAFGFAPDCEYSGDSDPAVPDLTGSSLQFANIGGRVRYTCIVRSAAILATDFSSSEIACAISISYPCRVGLAEVGFSPRTWYYWASLQTGAEKHVRGDPISSQ